MLVQRVQDKDAKKTQKIYLGTVKGCQFFSIKASTTYLIVEGDLLFVCTALIYQSYSYIADLHSELKKRELIFHLKHHFFVISSQKS